MFAPKHHCIRFRLRQGGEDFRMAVKVVTAFMEGFLIQGSRRDNADIAFQSIRNGPGNLLIRRITGKGRYLPDFNIFADSQVDDRNNVDFPWLEVLYLFNAYQRRRQLKPLMIVLKHVVAAINQDILLVLRFSIYSLKGNLRPDTSRIAHGNAYKIYCHCTSSFVTIIFV